jgi:hypothetical protein
VPLVGVQLCPSDDSRV